ncbi:amino acid ABC transporter substrate-binding protein [Roseobacter weihaiensis]|uniref:amino acid ABC transporter substrate-binding protein n=1 Tax=Roseobacter weihaiensis TaxID=2763262 RepID=UPI001D09C0C1|nr:amino acid ABC transporter substrate-binding protein [Roseobacter sp. H9]
MRLLPIILATALLLPAALGAQTLERIKESGEIKIGFRTDAPPLSYESDGRPQGYTPTVCFALAPLIGEALDLPDLEVVFIPVTTEDRFDKVASGEIDLLCGAATITLERREIVDFSTPVYVDGTTVALKKDAPETLEELAGEKIGVRRATTTFDALQNTLAVENIDVEIVAFDDHSAGVAALENDEIKAYFADQSILVNLVRQKENAEEFKVFDQILTVEKQGLALARGDTEFRLAVDRGLSELFQNGSIQKAFEKTLPGAEPGFALSAMFLLSPTNP